MSEQQETIFGQGLIFKRPHANAPEFVKGSMHVKVSEAIAFLIKYQEKDWVTLDLLASKDNSKLYFKLNTWKPPVKEEEVPPQSTAPEEDIQPEDIPFN